MLVTSVDLKIVDDPALCPEKVAVTVSRDGEAEEAFSCPLALDDAGACSCEAAIGDDKSGRFTIVATSYDGKRRGAVEVDVDGGYCHVEPQARTLSLK